ncbi:unnamed protein product [Rodentolepis nana]|uniref:WD_REPEATS_REGION domain-containing protein n=1 Tax=Rodentolepis nana TaxID=102285 RepID=A0A158QJ17_RODNA|nr:unnamed protein product [Rodentolepis nana]
MVPAMKYYKNRVAKLSDPFLETDQDEINVFIYEPLSGKAAEQYPFACKMMGDFTTNITRLTDEMNADSVCPNINSMIDITITIPKLHEPNAMIEMERNMKITKEINRIPNMDKIVYCVDENLSDSEHLGLVIEYLTSEQCLILAIFCDGENNDTLQILGKFRKKLRSLNSYDTTKRWLLCELAIWNWEDGTCVDIRIDQNYRHTKIKSFQPSFTDGRLLFCSGQYPCIVVMHAMQLSNLYVLSSNSHPNWIQDFSLFTHTHLQQEVVLGVSNSAVVTVWTLTGKETLNSTNFEHESRVVDTKSNVLQIHCCQQLPRLVLLICTDEWRILDAYDCSTLTLQKTSSEMEKFTGGSFFNRDYIAIFTAAGEGLIYRLSKDIFSKVGSGIQSPSSKTELVIRLKMHDEPHLTRPIRSLFQYVPVSKVSKSSLFRIGASENSIAAFICPRSDARICAWSLTTDHLIEPDEYVLELQPFMQTKLSECWLDIAKNLPNEPGFFNPTNSPDEVVTCCILAYLSTKVERKALPPLLIRGTSNGDIIISSPSNDPIHRFKAHKGALLSLLHPFSFGMHRGDFSPGILLSGGEDFAVRMWDLEEILNREEPEIIPLGTFYNHVGPIIGLTFHGGHRKEIVKFGDIAPQGTVPCSRSYHLVVLTVADDGTVSIISPNSKRTIIVARTASGGSANTPGTVHAVSWRLAEMMLLVLATDGSLAIWDIHTGQLERIETGPTAMRLFNTGSDLFVIGSRPPSTPLMAFNPINQSASAASVVHHTAPARLMPRNLGGGGGGGGAEKTFLPPLLLQSVGANLSGGPAAFVFHFDPEAIINNILTSAINPKDENKGVVKNPLSLRDCGSILKYLLSVIYPWSNSEHAGLMLEALQLPKCPRRPLYGCLSIAGFLALQFPNSNVESIAPTIDDCRSSKIATINQLVQLAIADALSCSPADRLSEIFPALTAPIETLLQQSILSPSSVGLLRQLRLHSLIARWQTKCIHIRHSARTLTFAYLDHLSAEERRALADQWSVYLPESNHHAVESNSNECNHHSEENPPSHGSTDSRIALDCCEKEDLLKFSIKLENGIYDSFASGPSKSLTASSIHHYRIVNCAILTLAALVIRSESPHLNPSLAARDLCVELNYPSTSHAASLSPYYDSVPPDVKIASSLLNEEVLRNLAYALLRYLEMDTLSYLKQPSTAQTSPLRRTAIDFLGRGILLWEPYLDVFRLLNSLLSPIADEPKELDDLQPGEVYNEQQDVARACRQALWKLAFTRPHLVILTLSLMLRRLGPHTLNAMFSAAAASANATGVGGGDGSQKILRVVVSSPALAAPILGADSLPKAQGLNPQITNQLAAPGMKHDNNVNPHIPSYVIPLIRAAPEMLRVLTELTSRRGLEMTPILPELVEVVLVCVNRTKLKERGLNFVFPILQQFHSVDSHTRAQKVCVGGYNGKLIFFDFKNGRYHTVDSAHKAPVTAVCFSSDGRQVASYSILENVMKTWQLSSTGLFGIGAQHVKPLNAYPIRPFQCPGGTTGTTPNPSDIVLSWPEMGVVNIFHSDVLIRSVPLSN